MEPLHRWPRKPPLRERADLPHILKGTFSCPFFEKFALWARYMRASKPAALPSKVFPCVAAFKIPNAFGRFFCVKLPLSLMAYALSAHAVGDLDGAACVESAIAHITLKNSADRFRHRPCFKASRPRFASIRSLYRLRAKHIPTGTLS